MGIALPESRAGYALAVLGAPLTLIAFSRYAVGFGLRCFFIALRHPSLAAQAELQRSAWST